MSRLENLKKMIGEKVDFDEIVCCFDDTDKEIIVDKSNNTGYDYIAYENSEDSIQYLFTADDCGIITDVWEC